LFGKRSAGASIESVSFDATGYSLQESSDAVRLWFTPDGDEFSVDFFARRPDLPRTLDELRNHYEAQLRASGGAVVEVLPIQVDECRAVKAVVKLPQPQSGLLYVASITMPFRDFSFVLKAICGESGVTGLREAVLLAKHMAAGGTPEISDGRVQVPGFDPDNERFDVDFSAHPLSRARRTIGHVSATARVDAVLKKAPAFAGILS
jgi:hypothetical protein